MKFDDNLVIFATPDKSNKTAVSTLERSKIRGNIQERLKRAVEHQLPNVEGLSPASNKRLWEKALSKYRQKYGKSKSVSLSREYTQSFSLSAPQCQSTPINPLTVSPMQVDAKQTRDASENTEIQMNNPHMGTQTSFIAVETKGIQVEGGMFGLVYCHAFHY